MYIHIIYTYMLYNDCETGLRNQNIIYYYLLTDENYNILG